MGELTVSVSIEIPGSNKNVPVTVKICKWCQEPFIPKFKENKFCTRKCQKTSWNKAREG